MTSAAATTRLLLPEWAGDPCFSAAAAAHATLTVSAQTPQRQSSAVGAEVCRFQDSAIWTLMRSLSPPEDGSSEMPETPIPRSGVQIPIFGPKRQRHRTAISAANSFSCLANKLCQRSQIVSVIASIAAAPGGSDRKGDRIAEVEPTSSSIPTRLTASESNSCASIR